MAAWLVRATLPDNAPELILLRWRTYGVRGFPIFPHPNHWRVTRQRVDLLLAGPRGQHFKQMNEQAEADQ